MVRQNRILTHNRTIKIMKQKYILSSKVNFRKAQESFRHF